MKAKAKTANSQPTLMVDSEVVRQIRQHARSSSKAEVCGILIGQDRDHHIEVAACIEGENAEEAGAHVTFTQGTWEHIYAVKDKKYPEARIVGWYHSHPGFGVFLSDHDTFIHKNFFSSPGQVAWVFDPHSDEEGCFGWVSGRIERLGRIAVVDRRGGEEAKESSSLEAASDSEVDSHAGRPPQQKKIASLKIQALEADEDSGGDESSLELLVTRVFVFLATLALGFALSWYLFPRIELMPVIFDPQTGQLIDPQTGQVIAVPKRPDKPGAKNQPSPADQNGAKGDNAQSK
jgi:proteasome lid subunit RPN8/RPN11